MTASPVLTLAYLGFKLQFTSTNQHGPLWKSMRGRRQQLENPPDDKTLESLQTRL